MNTWTIPLAIVFAGAVLAGAVYLTTRVPTIDVSALQPVDANDHIYGNPAATLKLVVYSDFDCPHCKTFDTVVRQIVAEHAQKGDLALVFRNLPLTELHPNAKKHAEAAECVAEASGGNSYFYFAAALFEHQPADPTHYAEYARSAGANPDQVASCIQNSATNGIDARIDAERTNAFALGIKSTPYAVLLMPGKSPVVIDGSLGYDDLRDQIQKVLAP